MAVTSLLYSRTVGAQKRGVFNLGDKLYRSIPESMKDK